MGGCYHVGCNSGAHGKATHLFKFPAKGNKFIRDIWTKNIPQRADKPWNFSTCRLCFKHFKEKFIIKTSFVLGVHGEKIVEVERKRWTLTPDAVPTIFSNDIVPAGYDVKPLPAKKIKIYSAKPKKNPLEVGNDVIEEISMEMPGLDQENEDERSDGSSDERSSSSVVALINANDLKMPKNWIRSTKLDEDVLFRGFEYEEEEKSAGVEIKKLLKVHKDLSFTVTLRGKEVNHLNLSFQNNEDFQKSLETLSSLKLCQGLKGNEFIQTSAAVKLGDKYFSRLCLNVVEAAATDSNKNKNVCIKCSNLTNYHRQSTLRKQCNLEANRIKSVTKCRSKTKFSKSEGGTTNRIRSSVPKSPHAVVTYFHCLVCSKGVYSPKFPDSIDSTKETENYREIFDNLCNYMEWGCSNVERHQDFDFTQNPLPFCKDCRSEVVLLHKLQIQLEEIQGKAQQVVATITAKILETRREPLSSDEECDSGWEERSKVYRGEVFNNYSVRVQIKKDPNLDSYPISSTNSDTSLLETDPGTDSVHEEDNNHPDIDSASEGKFSKNPIHSEVNVGTGTISSNEGNDDSPSSHSYDHKEKREPKATLKKFNGKVKVHRPKLMRTEKISETEFVVNGKFSVDVIPAGFTCRTCGHAFSRLRGAKTHVRRFHADDGRFVCHICGRKFPADCRLRDHLLTHQEGAFSFICEKCGKSFKSKGQLWMHTGQVHRRHGRPNRTRRRYGTEPGSFPCPACGKMFYSKLSRYTHSRLHAKVECDICGKETNKTYLHSHKLTHRAPSDEIDKNYECKICGKKFRHSSNLYVHKRVHSGEKPYCCDICGVRFVQSASMKKHKEKFHEVQHCTEESNLTISPQLVH